jgi:hypothetical protein
MHFALRGIAPWMALVCIAGCTVVDQRPKGHSPLAPIAAAEGQVTLEIFSAPAPPDDPQLATLWREVDEQPLPPELRKKLAENGLRAGVVGSRVPDALAALLKVTDKPISAEERSRVPLETEPGVTLRVLQPLLGKRHDLVVSPSREEIALLRSADGQVEGKTYKKAEGRLTLHVLPEDTGRLRLELVPELHHGEPRTQTAGSEGMFIWTTEREKRVFSELKIGATLGAGEMLLITCAPQRPGSVGHHFFMHKAADKPIQRLWVLRVAQAGPDRAFADWSAEHANSPPLESSP